MPDPLTAVFDLLEVKTAVYYMHDFVSPWGLRIPRRPHTHFHVLVNGTATVDVDERQFARSAGDVIFFVDGAEHASPTALATPERGWMDVVPRTVRGEIPLAARVPRLRRKGLRKLR